jgi:TetR/AcrR family transcriptional repressor of nem operon
MPWVKDFDVDDAVDRAMKVFWAKGYEATSISDLVEAMQINKGSLYNAFGNKKALFTRAFLKYDAENRQAAIKQLEAMDDPVKAIAVLFDGLIAESAADTERKGCLLVNTALDLPNQPKDIQDMVTSALDGFEAFFERRVRDGQKTGQIPASIDAKEAAKALVTLVVGLRVLARGTFDAKGLESIRAQALRTIAA